MLVLLLVLVAFFLPRDFRVERSIVIKASPDRVFAFVGDLKNWAKWGVWYSRDPAMVMTYSPATTGVGAWSAWESKTQGNGKATITESAAPSRLVYRLEFPDYGMTSTGSFVITPDAAGNVRVVMADAGDLGANPINRWFGLFYDRLIGPDFEAGIAKMKQLAETPSN